MCALLVSKINSGVPCPQGPQLNVSEQLLRDVKSASKRNNDLDLREKKQLPTMMLQSSRKMRVMTLQLKDICFHSLCNFVA